MSDDEFIQQVLESQKRQKEIMEHMENLAKNDPELTNRLNHIKECLGLKKIDKSH